MKNRLYSMLGIIALAACLSLGAANVIARDHGGFHGGGGMWHGGGGGWHGGGFSGFHGNFGGFHHSFHRHGFGGTSIFFGVSPYYYPYNQCYWVPGYYDDFGYWVPAQYQCSY